MRVGPLREERDASKDSRAENCRCIISAEGKTAVLYGLVEPIAESGAKRTRQNERTPEQQRSGDAGPEISCCDSRKSGGEYQRPAFVAEPVCIRHPVAKRGAERLRKQDRCPIEGLDLRRGHGTDGYGALGAVPEGQRSHQEQEQQRGAAGVADPERAV